MSNPRLSESQVEQAQKAIGKIRKEIRKIANNDPNLIFAFRRKIYKELIYDERGKPLERKRLKEKIVKKQKGLCRICKRKLPSRGSVLDRREAIKGYNEKNVRLICEKCDRAVQEKRKFK